LELDEVRAVVYAAASSMLWIMERWLF